MKLCFNRPNKTLGGHFKTKAIVKQLLATHQSYCKMLEKDAMELDGIKAAVCCPGLCVCVLFSFA